MSMRRMQSNTGCLCMDVRYLDDKGVGFWLNDNALVSGLLEPGHNKTSMSTRHVIGPLRAQPLHDELLC